mmetsp:Transcript_15517/g.44341  ORF Transcript_15517/g.44341 Transcript_15517/m.44341 type:complete len:312 (+) Transcript_15517:597-1532(+)
MERSEEDGQWSIAVKRSSSSDLQVAPSSLLVACGSSRPLWSVVEGLGHHVIPPVPSLFTLRLAKDDAETSLLEQCAGISMQSVRMRLDVVSHREGGGRRGKSGGGSVKLVDEGPMLITQGPGLSGPVTLRLSAFAARHLHESAYECAVTINWTGGAFKSGDQVLPQLMVAKDELTMKALGTFCPLQNVPIPRRLWRVLLEVSDIPPTMRWADVSKAKLRGLAERLVAHRMRVVGKGAFKEEFTTSGGIRCRDINWKTMESKILPNLYFAGEFVDVDGITGGYNLQSAWTTGWIAGEAIGRTALMHSSDDRQ